MLSEYCLPIYFPDWMSLFGTTVYYRHVHQRSTANIKYNIKTNKKHCITVSVSGDSFELTLLLLNV